MRIAQVAPLAESVPPRCYGGTERIVSLLTEELVARGHEVTLFASGDSTTAARLEPMCASALRTAQGVTDHLSPHLDMLEAVVRRQDEFDLVHFHLDDVGLAASRRLRVPSLSTVHGRLDLESQREIYRAYPDARLVAISHAQRANMPELGWVGTVHHGLSPRTYRFAPTPGRHLLFLGRISPEKAPDRAIRIAQRAGLPLKIAAKIAHSDRDYYESAVRPLLDLPGIEFLGEVDDREKAALLGASLGLLFPIDWPEPFGLVVIEALACGTPVVAYPNGAVPELLEPGLNGFVVTSEAEAAQACGRLASLDRRACRDSFERRFTVDRMVDDYLRIYERLLQGESAGERDAAIGRGSALRPFDSLGGRSPPGAEGR